jgi:Mrp family chromosome partitioning ATPase/capsular polysaccharide biosynthesis protein
MNEQHGQPETLDLRSYFRPIWRRKWIILAIVVVATGATYFISSRQHNSYAASTKVYVEVANPTVNVATGSGSSGSIGLEGVPLTPTTIADVAQLITAQGVTNVVARRLGISASSAEQSVTATPDATSDFVTVAATSGSQQLAARLANSYVSAFLQQRAQGVAAQAVGDERAARAALSVLPVNSNNTNDVSQRQDLLQAIQTYRQIALNPSPGARQVDPAAVPNLPSSPKPTRDAIFGGVVGLVLAVIIAFCLDLLDRRLVSVATVESMFGSPVLAVLPHVGDPTPLLDGRPIVPPQFLEALRSLTVMVRLEGNAGAPHALMVTSTLPREGKSTVTRDLALVYAEAGQRVLVIDGDLRRPSMEALFRIEAEHGLAHVVRGEASLADAVVTAIGAPKAEASTNGHGKASSNGSRGLVLSGSVDVLSHGETSENPLALLSSEHMMALIADASETYDIVVMDTPPVLAVADTVPLMEVFDKVLLVARLGQTTRHAAHRFRELVDRLSDVNFVGVIANDRREQLDDGYGSYYGYGYYSYRGEGRRDRKQTGRGQPEATAVEPAMTPREPTNGPNNQTPPRSENGGGEGWFGRSDRKDASGGPKAGTTAH